jgi:hypothetical protein
MNPSLLLIPDRYKAAKLYSQIPDSGDGDLTFARNSNATRVNSAGLIEKVRTNLILQSEAFNTTWSATNATVTANTTSNPLNNDLTADTITLSAGTTQKRVLQPIPLNGSITVSAYLKAGTHQFVQFMLGSDTAPVANFDLVNGTASATGSTANILSIGNGWFRCSMSFTTSTADAVFILAVDSLAATYFASTASTGTFIVFGYQLETGDIATDYIPTTTAAVSVGITADIPRLDYTGGGCPSLLLEPQRANLALFSEQLNNAAWTKSSVTITANNIVSPDGYTNADLATATAGGELLQFTTLSASTAYTFSFYVKKGTAADAKYRVYNFDNGTNVVAPTSYISQTNTSTWVRVSVSFTSSATGVNYGIYLIDQASAGTMFFYGAQLEAGSYVSSYIPTLGSSVTRLADAASKTGISSLIGQTSGTVFADFNCKSVANTGSYDSIINIATDANNSIDIIKNNTTAELYVFAIVGGVIQVNSVGIPGTNVLGNHKVALAYNLNDYVCYLDGVQVFTDTSATVPACSNLYVGQYLAGTGQLGGTIKTAALYTTRLSNSELASITTL